MFVCKAENKFGSSERVVHLVVQVKTPFILFLRKISQGNHLSVQEVPESPLRLTVASYSSRTANLTWGHPFDGQSEITAFHVEYKKSYRE